MSYRIQNVLSHNYLFNNLHLADVVFQFEAHAGEIQRIPAHKFVLCSRSSVFRDMFKSVKNEQAITAIAISDVSIDVFRDFLRIFYQPSLLFESWRGHIYELLMLCDKYDVADYLPMFTKICELKPMFWYVTYEFLLKTDQSDEIKINRTAFDICRTAEQSFAFAAKAVGSLNRALLQMLLESDYLSENEYTVFMMAIAWAKASLSARNVETHSVNIKTELDNCLALVRFPLMTVTQLVNVMDQFPKLISGREFRDLLRYVDGGHELKYARRFSTQARKGRSELSLIYSSSSTDSLMSTPPL